MHLQRQAVLIRPTSARGLLILSALAGCLWPAAHAQSAFELTVNATSNIFYAGTQGITPPANNCNQGSNGLGDGTLPPSISLPSGLRSLQFTARNTADIRYGMPGESGDPVRTPDGRLYSGGPTYVTNDSATMPGMQLTGRYGMLAAVFLDGNTITPTGTGGSVSSYSTAQMNAVNVAPTLRNPFFMGDGTAVDWPAATRYDAAGNTSAYPSPTLPDGTQQRSTFAVPANATRLFFGFADAGGVYGANRCYLDNAGSVFAKLAMATSDDSGAVAQGTGGVAVADVRTNDYLDGNAPSAPRSTIQQTGTWPSGIALNTSSGAVSVAPTVAAGTYVQAYTLCDTSTSPASCADANVTIQVSATALAPVVANADTGSTTTAGGTPIANVRANDTVNGAQATSGNSTITQQGVWPAGITLDPATGAVSVAAGTAAQVYSLSYQLCDAASAGNCKTATIAITVNASGARPISAGNDSADVPLGTTGPVIANVRANDSLNGATPTDANTTLEVIGNLPSGVSFNTGTGEVAVTSALAAGTYTFQYALCEARTTPSNCAVATVQLLVPGTKVPVPATDRTALIGLALLLAVAAWGVQRRSTQR